MGAPVWKIYHKCNNLKRALLENLAVRCVYELTVQGETADEFLTMVYAFGMV
jgi:hypothetical protein